jgi:hypothetical protein
MAVLAGSSISCAGTQEQEQEQVAALDEGDEGASLDSITLGDGSASPAEVGSLSTLQLVVVSNVSTAGSTVVVPRTDPNDASWTLNAPSHVWGEISRVTATVVHDGFLTGGHTQGWDHLAVVTRGTSVDGAHSLVGIPSWQSQAFFWGEHVSSQGYYPDGTMRPELQALIKGRGPTFWASGANGACTTNPTLPCLIFENYAMHGVGPVLIGAPIPLALNSGPFEIRVDTDDYDIQVWVWQNGQQKAYASCRQFTGNDARCGRMPSDGELGDTMFGFIMGTVPSYVPNRSIGVLNARSQVLQWQYRDTCPRCAIP